MELDIKVTSTQYGVCINTTRQFYLLFSLQSNRVAMLFDNEVVYITNVTILKEIL